MSAASNPPAGPDQQDGPDPATLQDRRNVPDIPDVPPRPSAGPGRARYRVACPACGPVEVSAGELRLVVAGSAGRPFYSFCCPGCGEQVRKPAGERIVELLTGGEVAAVRLYLC